MGTGAIGVSPGFVNTNTGFFGQEIRKALRHDERLRRWIHYTTLDCSSPGHSRVSSKINLSHMRTRLDLELLANHRMPRSRTMIPSDHFIRKLHVSNEHQQALRTLGFRGPATREFSQVFLTHIIETTDGRLSGQENLSSPTCQVFNDLPRLWFLGVSQKVS